MELKVPDSLLPALKEFAEARGVSLEEALALALESGLRLEVVSEDRAAYAVDDSEEVEFTAEQLALIDEGIESYRRGEVLSEAEVRAIIQDKAIESIKARWNLAG